jgi:SAM-dependent methyltransferase
MTKTPRIRRVVRWRSPLGPSLCPYDNRLWIARWFFYRRYALALKVAGPLLPGRVLDLGCWEGHFLPSLLASSEEVWAIDNDCASIIDRMPGRWTILQVARDLCRTEGLTLNNLFLTKADGVALPFQSKTFDVVFCLDSLPFTQGSHHTVISEIRRILKDEGLAVITLPIEGGAALLVREALRILSGSWRDGYNLSDLMRAIRWAPSSSGSGAAKNLFGYDYRRDILITETFFTIDRMLFLPWHCVRWLSPTVLLVCKPKSQVVHSNVGSS